MTPWVTRLLVANVVAFFFTAPSPGVIRALALVPALVPFQPWTLLTYMFLHAGLGHLFFNMLGLFFFGPRLEARLGGKRFLMLYFLSGIGGAVLSFFFTPLTPIIGASGAVFGVLIGFAMFWPRENIYIWGILPVQARVLVVVMTVLALMGGFGARDNIAHFAHLGGFGAGFLYLKALDKWSPARRFKEKASGGKKTAVAELFDAKRWDSIDRESLHPINREEFDRIKDKMKSQGPASLTRDERAFMERFTPKA